jgi:hypothetical protein
VTQAFLSLLTRSRGAIVNVLSVATLAALPVEENQSLFKIGKPDVLTVDLKKMLEHPAGRASGTG